MEQKKLLRMVYFLYLITVSVETMIYTALFVAIEGLVLSFFNADMLERIQQDFLILPKWFCISFVLVFLSACFLCLLGFTSDHWSEEADRMHHALEKEEPFPDESVKAPEMQEESMLDALEPSANRCKGMQILNGCRWEARYMARFHQITLPTTERVFNVFFLLPVLICSLLFGMQIREGHQLDQQIQNSISQAVERLETVCEPHCDSIDHYTTIHDDISCTAQIYSGYEDYGSQMQVMINPQGKVDNLTFILDVVPDLPMEENLQRIQKELALLHGLFMEAQLETEEGHYRDLDHLPPEFESRFLKADPYTDVEMVDTRSGEISVFLSGINEEMYDYKCYVHLSVESHNSARSAH